MNSIFFSKVLKGGYPTHQCFICDFEGRKDELHYIGHKWNERQRSVVGMGSVINEPLVHKDKIILPPLHIKLGIFKSSIVASKLTKESESFNILKNILKLSDAKVIAGWIFL